MSTIIIKSLVNIRNFLFPIGTIRRNFVDKLQKKIFEFFQKKIQNIHFVENCIDSNKSNESGFFDLNFYNEIEPINLSNQIDIIICVGNNVNNIEECLKSIKKYSKEGTYKIHLVLHKNDLEKVKKIVSTETIHLHNMDVFNFSKANNLVLKNCNEDVILLNDDTEVSEGWIEKLQIASKGIALTGAHTDKFCSGNPQMWGEGPTIITHFPINMFCVFIPKRIREVVGLLDEQFIYYGGEDVDYSCRAILNGFPLIISNAFIKHKNNQSFKDLKDKLIIESDKILFEKYKITSPFNLSAIQPMVSVIIATKDRASLLKNALSTIRKNKYENIEIIIIDDNSTEKTFDVVENFQKYDDRIIYLRLPRSLGSNNARNLGVKISKGNFIIFTDDDDLVLDNRIISPLKQILYKPLLDVVYCDYFVYDDNGEVVPIVCQKFDEKDYLEQKFNIGLGILLGRRDVFTTTPLSTRYDHAGDYDWVFRIIRNGYKIDYCPIKVMYYNRTGSSNLHLSGNRKSILEHQEIFERENLLNSIQRK